MTSPSFQRRRCTPGFPRTRIPRLSKRSPPFIHRGEALVVVVVVCVCVCVCVCHLSSSCFQVFSWVQDVRVPSILNNNNNNTQPTPPRDPPSPPPLPIGRDASPPTRRRWCCRLTITWCIVDTACSTPPTYKARGRCVFPFFFSRTQHSQTIGQSTRRVSTVSSTCTCLLG